MAIAFQHLYRPDVRRPHTAYHPLKPIYAFLTASGLRWSVPINLICRMNLNRVNVAVLDWFVTRHSCEGACLISGQDKGCRCLEAFHIRGSRHVSQPRAQLAVCIPESVFIVVAGVVISHGLRACSWSLFQSRSHRSLSRISAS